MARSRKLSCLTAMAAFLACAALAVAQGAGPTLHFTKHGNADVNAQLNLVFKTGPKGTTTTGGDGNATIPGNILSANKPHTHMNVYQCPDGTLYAVEDGAEGGIPCPEKKRRKLGGFYLDDSGTIEINEDAGTPVANLPQNPIVSMQVGGGVGFKNFGGTSGERAAFLRTFPGGTFNTQANSFAGDVGTSLNVGPVVFDFNAWQASENTSNGSFPLQGGGTDTVEFARQLQGITVTGGGKIPLGPKASFIVRGGGNFWHVNIDTKETETNGTTTSTVTNTRSVEGRGWTVGGALQVDMSRRWSVVVRYDYIPMSTMHLNEGSVGMMFRLFGPPGK